jgi:uncharacterized membrane protein
MPEDASTGSDAPATTGPAAPSAETSVATPPVGGAEPPGGVLARPEPAGGVLAEAEQAPADTVATEPEPAESDSATPGKLPAGSATVFNLTLPGCWGALIFGCLSFTPSLLPRSGLLQGLICGITAATGYGLGVTAAWIWRAFANREAAKPPRGWAWRVFLITGIVLFALSFGLGQYWQHQIRKLMDVTEYNVVLAVLSPLIAAGMFLLLLAISRGIRRLYRWVVRMLNRWIGPRAARATGWILVAGLSYLLITGLLLDGLVNIANSAFSVRNGTTPEGVTQPTSSLRSGSPDSLVPWDTLGKQGRKFVGLGPTANQITQVTGQRAVDPIRVYAGLESADSTEARAALAVDDLVRAGGLQRKNLLVFTTTGSGWVDPAAVDSFEYLTGGDSATIAIQYSYLPSWISYLVDQSKAREAGRDLFDAVYDRWSKLPLNNRPRLFVAGESLGSFGGETAFSGEYDLRNRTTGTLFVGPPNFNALFREFTDNRDPGSPEIEPVYKDGRTVRFTDNVAVEPAPQSQSWDGTRVLYLMHPSDPIVWWTPRLLFSKPDWLSEARGSDVLKQVVWLPVVTFWQVTADLPFATGVPGGHGHKYTGEYVDAWNDVLQPSGISADQLANIRKIINDGG